MNTEAGSPNSNDIELQESKPSDSILNTYSNNDPWAGTMSEDMRSDMDHYYLKLIMFLTSLEVHPLLDQM